MGLKLSNGWLWTRGGALPFARRFARCCRRFAGLVGLPAARPPARTGLPILLTLAAAIAATGLAQESRQYPFSGGETLRYAVKWKSLPAGNAVLSVHQDKVMTGRWNIAATATSVGYVSNIYKVADEYHSTFRNPAFCSLGTHKTIHEGGRD